MGLFGVMKRLEARLPRSIQALCWNPTNTPSRRGEQAASSGLASLDIWWSFPTFRSSNMTLWYAVTSTPIDVVNGHHAAAAAPAQKRRSAPGNNQTPPKAPAQQPSASDPVEQHGHFDIEELEDAYELVADAPGFGPGDISVDLDQDKMLKISGQLEEKELQQEEQAAGKQAQETKVKVWRKERRPCRFNRTFELPDNADADRITASLDKGVLTVRIPKLPPAKPELRRIVVQGAAVPAH